ncbi:hypothetical protein [Halorubrum sp. Boch-26]|uniref:DUF7857 domain-containing protein n=1 Tax=Halorubrum sp. Boch-26 TaxID=2994426 RepID=UPI0024699AA2|nr:hypothetical protein [Halorubrum sp. Boch-26]
MDLSWTVDRAGDASLVRCRARNDDAVPRRVRVESRFDAPVLPPRRAGVPIDGWDASGVTLQIGPGERRGFGFAVPAPPVDPPVEIVEITSVDPDESARGIAGSTSDGGDADSTPADALRDLAEYRPPRAAVDGAHGVGERRDDTTPLGDAHGADSERSDTGESGRATPDAVDDWFAAVETRVDRAERLADADVETATEVVADAGGVDAIADLASRVDADAERLRAVSERAASLADRAAETEVPVGALERLA